MTPSAGRAVSAGGVPSSERVGNLVLSRTEWSVEHRDDVMAGVLAVVGESGIPPALSP